MRDDPSQPCEPRAARAAVLGAGAVLALIWAGVIGYSLYQGQTDEAVLWLAVAISTLTAVVPSAFDKGGPE